MGGEAEKGRRSGGRLREKEKGQERERARGDGNNDDADAATRGERTHAVGGRGAWGSRDQNEAWRDV